MRFLQTLHDNKNGLDRGLAKVWRAARAWLIRMEGGHDQEYLEDDEFPVET